MENNPAEEYPPIRLVNMQQNNSWGRGRLVVKVTDSWLACHEFELSTTENPPCRDCRELKRHPIGGVIRRGGASSVVVLVP
ncbi:hypothetical protein TNCV_3081301 [Trichonephila clavipes]|nr:hypothetical protein TNCV_3081301 [Trichonephila clavipes]